MICPVCQSRIPDSDVFCTFCGTRVGRTAYNAENTVNTRPAPVYNPPAQQTRPPAQPYIPPAQQAYVPQQTGYTPSPAGGAAAQPPASPPPETPGEPKNKRIAALIVLIAGAVLLIAGIVLLLVYLNGSPSGRDDAGSGDVVASDASKTREKKDGGRNKDGDDTEEPLPEETPAIALPAATAEPEKPAVTETPAAVSATEAPVVTEAPQPDYGYACLSSGFHRTEYYVIREPDNTCRVFTYEDGHFIAKEAMSWNDLVYRLTPATVQFGEWDGVLPESLPYECILCHSACETYGNGTDSSDGAYICESCAGKMRCSYCGIAVSDTEITGGDASLCGKCGYYCHTGCIGLNGCCFACGGTVQCECENCGVNFNRQCENTVALNDAENVSVSEGGAWKDLLVCPACKEDLEKYSLTKNSPSCSVCGKAATRNEIDILGMCRSCYAGRHDSLEVTFTYSDTRKAIDFTIPVSGFVIKDSDTRLIAEEELEGMTNEQLNIARNEIYARSGYVFSRQLYKDYFAHMPWYHPCANADDWDANGISYYGYKNIDTIKQYQAKLDEAAAQDTPAENNG